jgi:hypothetical protein
MLHRSSSSRPAGARHFWPVYELGSFVSAPVSLVNALFTSLGELCAHRNPVFILFRVHGIWRSRPIGGALANRRIDEHQALLYRIPERGQAAAGTCLA